MNTLRALATRWGERGVRRRIARHARQLQPLRVQGERIAKAWCILVCCARNERVRMPQFLAHYRRLGVAHFLIIDNDSSDGLADALAAEPDCSVWLARGSYRDANFGMDWCNHLLARHGVDKWCVTVDPDEFLVYPYSELRSLHSLTRHMQALGQDALFTVMIDAYGQGAMSDADLTPDTNPFDLCPWHDAFNLTQRFDERRQNYWVQGGVRMRRFFADTPELAPALNKVPLVKWRRGLLYESSMHHLNDPVLNCTIHSHPAHVSGALFHFKYVNLLAHKASEELTRGEHYGGSQEYRAYAKAGDLVLWDAQHSVRYHGSGDLVRQGFMQAGVWF